MPCALRIEHIESGQATGTKRDHVAGSRAIRHEVFVREQGVPESLEFDGLDDEAEHFIAWYEGRTTSPVASGVARLRRVGATFKAERVAVLPAKRRRGVGEQLMRALEARARELGAKEVTLHAQIEALPFYERIGYRAYGPIFEEAGIDHRSMRKPLHDSPPDPSS